MRSCSLGIGSRKTIDQSARPQRRGIVLVIVLMVVVIISLAGFSFVAFMFTENKGVHLRGEELQAAALVDSGEEFLKAFLQQPAATRIEYGGTEDNPDLFRAVALDGDVEGENFGRFSIVSPETDFDRPGPRFGIIDESAKLNLAALLEWDRLRPGSAREALLVFPGMTESIADALLDWVDTDSNTRENGAEDDYYSGLDPAYRPRNGIPESYEELLLVKGVTRSLLFGSDIDDTEPTTSDRITNRSTLGSRTSSHDIATEWTSLLTFYSAELNVNSQGKPRIDLNSEHTSTLYQSLLQTFDDQLARFVVLYRQFGPTSAVAPVADLVAVEFHPASPATFLIVSPLDLVDARVMIPSSSGGESVIVNSPLSSNQETLRQLLPKFLDDTSISRAPVITGRININSASPAVLEAVPGLDPSLVEQILSARKVRVEGDLINRRQPTWLLTDGLVDLPKMRALLPFVTGGGDVHRAEIIGFFDEGGPSARKEIVIDATTRPPRAIYWKDLRSLGPGYLPEQIGLEPRESAAKGFSQNRSTARRVVLKRAGALSTDHESPRRR